MIGSGRESKESNDLFYTCSLIDYIARKTKNERKYVVNKIGKVYLEKMYDLADVYHCDNIDSVSDYFIKECQIENGNFDNVGDCRYAIPTYWDIGKVYKRLVLQVEEEEKIGAVDALLKVYNSFLSSKILNNSVGENLLYVEKSFKPTRENTFINLLREKFSKNLKSKLLNNNVLC